MPLGRSGDGAGPSAHPISQPNSDPVTPALDAEAEGTKLPGVADEDASLYLDLLRKARGDATLAGRWLAQISSSAPTSASGGGGQGSAAAAPSSRGDEGAAVDLDAAAAAAGAPASFFCPISLKLMRDPVTLSTGQSYDRKFIFRWLAAGKTTCPATNTTLGRPVSQVPNVALRKAIEDWAERHALWLLGPDGRIKPIPAGDDFSSCGDVGGASTSGAAAASIDDALRLQAEALERHAASNGGDGGMPGGGGTEGRPSAPPLQGLGFGVGGGRGGAAGSCGASEQHHAGSFPPLPPYDHPPHLPRPLPPPPPLPPYPPAPYPPAPYPPALYPPAPYSPPPPPRPVDGAIAALGSTRLLSLLTYASSGATLALFVVSLWKNGWEVAPLRSNPLVGASPAVLTSLGAKDGGSIIDGSQWWRLFSSAFSCAGAVDVAVVSSLSWTLGHRTVARSVVAPSFSVPLIYVSSAVFGGLASTNLLPRGPTPSVGAPAGCAGLLGAAACYQLLHWRRFSSRLGTALALAGVAGVLGALAILPLNDCFYVGGAAAFGVVAAPVLSNGGATTRRRDDAAPSSRPSASSLLSSLFRLLLFFSLAGAIAAGVVGVTKYRGSWGERVCGERCTRAACVETKWWSCDGGGVGGGSSPSPPPPPSSEATPACSATVEGDTTKVTCPPLPGGGGGAAAKATKTLQGKRDTAGKGLVSVCREACFDGGGGVGSPPPAPRVTPVPVKDGVAADPSKGVLI